ncbi:MAG: MFS transporter [Candidatus Acidiferrales bacterium]|jgi:DHA2 family multidrug resistance protein-like MFS transporter
MSEAEITGEIFGGMSATDGLPTAQRRWAMLTFSIGLAMSVLDGNIANTALPNIAKQLHANPDVSIWVVNAFLLTVAICVVPLSSLADIIGYKRVYQAGLALFTLASVGCSLPRSLETLVLARIFQGVGAACMWSVSAAVMRYTYPRALLGRGVGLSGIVVFTSAAAGPSIASGILAVASWHWLFAINIPFGLLALSMSEKFLAPAEGTRHRWDLWSAVLNAVTVTLLVTGIDGVGERAHRGIAVLELLGAATLGTLMVRRQISLRVPMLAIDLFERPIFALASVASLCAFMAQGLAFVVLPFYFVDVLGVSQVRAGLLLTPWPMAAGAMSHIAGRLADRHSIRILGTTGMLVMSAGLFLLALAPPHPTTFDIVWRAALGGAGFGFFGAPNNRAMVASAPRERSGGAGGIATMSRLLGQSIGISVVAVTFGVIAQGGVTLRGVSIALLFGAGFALVSAAINTARVPHIHPD